MIKHFIVSVLFYLAISTPLFASEDRALFWRVDSASATVYLFGSIHFADESFYPLRKEIEQAFDDSSTLVVEVDINSEESMQQFQLVMQNEGYYSGSETLKDNLSAETYQQLQQYLAEAGVPISLVEKQKPGVVMLALAAIQAQQVGLKSEYGIDLHFLNQRNNKKLLALETMDEQLRIFLDIEDADALLRDSFDSVETLDEEMAALIKAWKQGDEKSLFGLLFENLENEDEVIIALYERLYYQRNIKMAAAVKDYLKQKGTFFVVVGAGHLVGEKGIMDLLRMENHRIKRL